MALRFLERELRDHLVERGREELAEAAVGAVTFTDDGGTIYVHMVREARVLCTATAG
jgi:hypothetical protein